MSLPKDYKVLNQVPVSKDVLPKIRVSKLMPEGHGKCVRCGIEATRVITYTLAGEEHKQVYINIFAGSRMMTADHILPRSLGGSDALSNLQLMCYKCNTRKNNTISAQERQMIISNRSNHIRCTFKPEHMRHILKRFPLLNGLYDLSGQEDGPAIAFNQRQLSLQLYQNQIPRMSKVKILSNGLVTSKHPHHPMWGWVRIFKRFPEMKNVVRFTP